LPKSRVFYDFYGIVNSKKNFAIIWMPTKSEKDVRLG